VAASYNNIGMVYDSQGKYEEALEVYQKALEIRTRVFGSDHPDVANSCLGIGNVYYRNALIFGSGCSGATTRMWRVAT